MELPAVTAPDADIEAAATARLGALAVPRGALGRLGTLAVWLAATQGKCPPEPPSRPRVVMLAGDHGIAEAGVSVHPAGGTARLIAEVREQTAPVGVLAAAAGMAGRVVDVALDSDAPGEHRVRRGSGRIDREDALTEQEAEQALAVGRAIADEEVDAGADLLIPASLGVGATTPAAVLICAVTRAEPVAVVGRGSGIDDVAWMRKVSAIRDALRRARPHARDPLALLRVAGGADIAALAGFCLQAALRRTPVLLDGVTVGAAAVLADDMAPGARAWWRIAQRSPDPGAEHIYQHLRGEPLQDLAVRLEDGTGAAAVLPLLGMAARLLAETGGRTDPAGS